MQATRKNIGCGILVAVLLLPACSTRKNDVAPRPTFTQIEDLTRKSCLCRMAGRNAAAVEQRLMKLTAGLRKDGFGSASAPMSSEATCYPELGERACTGEYQVVATGARDFVCSAEQADELERIWSATRLDADRKSTRADAALLRGLSEMRKAAAKAIPQSACN